MDPNRRQRGVATALWAVGAFELRGIQDFSTGVIDASVILKSATTTTAPTVLEDGMRLISELDFVTKESSMLLTGAGYARIVRDDRGGASALQPIPPALAQVAVSEAGTASLRIRSPARPRRFGDKFIASW